MNPEAVHPVEKESYRILGRRVDLSHLGPGSRAVVARVVHATADLAYADTMVVDERSAEAGVEALRAGAPVVADVEMLRLGITTLNALCYLPAVSAEPGSWDPPLTRSATGMRLAASAHPQGAIFVVGCAPTALTEVVRMAEEGALDPALVVGTPVGFVGAAESKDALRASGLPSISNRGEKGGSSIAAAVVNSLSRLALGRATS